MGIVPTELVFVALYLLPLVFLVFMVRRVLKRLDRAEEEGSGEGVASAGEALDRRYAEGEISREEYLEIGEDMTKEENVR